MWADNTSSSARASLCSKKAIFAPPIFKPSTMEMCARASTTATSPLRINPAADPSAPPKPLLKMSTEGYPVNAASLCSSVWCSALLPERIGDPHAPVP